jgi:TNF receptor-associated factor 3
MKEFAKHQMSCPDAYALCPLCLAALKTRDIQQHIEYECDSLRPLLKCRYGCSGSFRSGAQLDDHSRQNVSVHLDSVCETLNSLSTKHEALTQRHETWQKEGTTEAASKHSKMTAKCEKIHLNVTQLKLKIAEIQSKAHVEDTDTKVAVLNDAIIVLHKEIFNDQNRLKADAVKDRAMLTSLQDRMTCIVSSQLRLELAVFDLEDRFKTVELGCMDGTLVWKITDVAAKTRQAKNGEVTSIYSPHFTTSRHGYKVCARLYLNGDGMGKGTHVSLFFVLLRGDYDALQQWPFRSKVTLTLIDQLQGKKHHMDAFRPDTSSSSFARPISAMNVASGCPLFIPKSKLEQSGNPFLVNDTLFFKLEVEPHTSCV